MRLPPGTAIDSDDWYDVLSAVFDRLNTRNERELWGFTEDEYAEMTRGQQAVFNLRRLRDYMEADTFLESRRTRRAHAFIPVPDVIAPRPATTNTLPFGVTGASPGPTGSARRLPPSAA